jgi:hypothetical protein
MSVDLRALLHYGQSPPLLHELRLIRRLQYLSTARSQKPRPGQVWRWGGGLTILQAQVRPDGMDGSVIPKGMDDVEMMHYAPYTEWWKKELVVTGEDGRAFSRAFLVTKMSNLDGAHTDPYLDGDYESLGPRLSLWRIGTPGESAPVVSDVAAASIRQVTSELLRTLERDVPELVQS